MHGCAAGGGAATFRFVSGSAIAGTAASTTSPMIIQLLEWWAASLLGSRRSVL